ncbi:hypothetical protein [Microcoleus sp. FACHB-672]|uniref:hypothetical protein n=1 Tax=Microcoleus sp. FACHB-672 TaxID=2692825 RepID=UPI001683B4BD|nr:hypothetical protein [Microcoleus sp. FACHB-672]MBD2039241.1 hypothetical protein [Microcoleus sp. FACHB-672]
MNVITQDWFAFRIPEIPARYRANCSKEWGCFVTGETSKMTCSQAEKAGFTRGNFVEMALCWVDNKVLTFEPHYINESFTEIWGIPVAGEMKSNFHEKCSELSTFLIHRQSKDKMNGLIEVFGREAFNQWVSEGMKGDAHDYAIQKAAEIYFSNIFRFEMVQTEGGYGAYFYVQATYRKASDNEFEQAALKAAKQIYEGQIAGLGYCTDPRLEDNQASCQAALASPDEATAQLPAAKPAKLLKPKA